MTDVARETLHHAPERTLDALPRASESSSGELYKTVDHPLRIVSDWCLTMDEGEAESLQRRRRLLATIERYSISGWFVGRCGANDVELDRCRRSAAQPRAAAGGARARPGRCGSLPDHVETLCSKGDALIETLELLLASDVVVALRIAGVVGEWLATPRKQVRHDSRAVACGDPPHPTAGSESCDASPASSTGWASSAVRIPSDTRRLEVCRELFDHLRGDGDMALAKVGCAGASLVVEHLERATRRARDQELCGI